MKSGNRESKCALRKQLWPRGDMKENKVYWFQMRIYQKWHYLTVCQAVFLNTCCYQDVYLETRRKAPMWRWRRTYRRRSGQTVLTSSLFQDWAFSFQSSLSGIVNYNCFVICITPYGRLLLPNYPNTVY